MKTKNKRIIISLSLTIAFIITAAISIYYKNNTAGNLKCMGNYNIANSKETLQSTIRVTFDKQHGALVLRGAIKNTEGKTAELTITFLFNVNIINRSYALKLSEYSVKQLNHRTPGINLNYEHLLPPVFYKKNSLAVYTIHHQPDGNYIFSVGDMPVFFCVKQK